jgi:hypothetical protein
MTNKTVNNTNDKFLEFTRKLVAVPKKEIDEQLKLEREKRQKKKEGKRK